MSAELHAFLRSRRSVRRFKPEPVPEPVLRRVLETATHAPSAHNDQPWRFALLTGAAPKSALAGAMGSDFRRDLERDGLTTDEIATRLERSRRRIEEAPVVVILCMDMAGMDHYPDEARRQAEHDMALQSTALAGLQLLLAAHAEGLGGVWTCGPLFVPETTRSTLDLPAGWEPQAMLLLGYPAETAREKQLRPLDEVARFLP